MSFKKNRQSKRLVVDLFVNKFVGDEPFACCAKNLSADGVYLHRLIEPMRTDAEDFVGLEFVLPGNEEVIWASGKIIREEQDGDVGIQFLSMAERHRQMLSEFVAQVNA